MRGNDRTTQTSLSHPAWGLILGLLALSVISTAVHAQSDGPAVGGGRTTVGQDIAASRENLRALIREHGGDSLAVARERSRLGSLLYLDNQSLAATRQLQTALPALQRKLGLFHPQLVEPLGYLGLSQQALGLNEAAADSLTRAQHITHRSLGTLNENQIPLVYSKADAIQASGDMWQAEQLQYMVYRLHEHNFGPAAAETLGALNRLGTWLTRAGRTRPALTLYRLALRDMLDENGNDTPEMAPLLEGMARTFLFTYGVRGRSLNLLQRVVNLTESFPDNFGPGDRFMANLQLGDTLLLFSLERDALKRYTNAWRIADESPVLGDWERRQFTDRKLVAGPFMELTEDGVKTQTWFRFRFDLRPDGRPGKVKLVDTNALAGVVSQTIARFRAARFRPLIVDGVPQPRTEQEILVAYRGISRIGS
ncbi:MAG: tetratricopeptide repeat protein [Pseudomonadota bacterium]